MLPLGGDREHGSHKGYAPGSIVDIFSAVLSGASYVPGYHLFLAYVPVPTTCPAMALAIFRSHADRCIQAKRRLHCRHEQLDKKVSRSQTCPGHEKVLISGDPKREMEVTRRKEGIPLFNSVVEI